MKIAMLYASWEKFGEKWSTPIGVKNELVARGHDVQIYNLYHADGDFLPKRKERSYSNDSINRLIAEVRAGSYKPDVIFLMDYGPWDCMQFDKQYFPGVVLVNEAGDEPQSHRMMWLKAPKVHVVLSPDQQCVEHYRQFGYAAEFWTHHADHRIFYPRPEIPEQFDCVTTCGPRGAGLTETIKAALGDAFNNERYFYDEEHAKRLCMGKMVFQCSQYKEITRRIFEGMACGKLVITDRLPLETKLHELFIEGEDIVYYDSAEDAIEKIRHYASNDAERIRVATNGYNKVMAHHTVKQRVDVFEQVVNKAQKEILV
jgi:hypothetical protein